MRKNWKSTDWYVSKECQSREEVAKAFRDLRVQEEELGRYGEKLFSKGIAPSTKVVGYAFTNASNILFRRIPAIPEIVESRLFYEALGILLRRSNVEVSDAWWLGWQQAYDKDLANLKKRASSGAARERAIFLQEGKVPSLAPLRHTSRLLLPNVTKFMTKDT